MRSGSFNGLRAAASLLFFLLPACATVVDPRPVQVGGVSLWSLEPRVKDQEAIDAQGAPSGDAQGEQQPQDPAEKEPQEPKPEESEVIEERRRGAEAETPTDDRWWKGTRVFWDRGPHLTAFDGDLRIVLGGRFHGDLAYFTEDDDIVAAFGEPDPGFEVRRAFLELGGVYKNFEGNFWVNFSDEFDTPDERFGAGVDFRNVFVGVRGLPVIGGVRFGYFKEPFGLEEITSSNDITFMERSLTDAFVERRNLGIMLNRRLTEERRIYMAAGVFREMNNDLETSDGYGVTARVTAAPVLAKDGRQVVHVGASATYRWPADDTLRFYSRPESVQAQVMADTLDFAADRDVRAGLELGTVLGSLSLQSEFIMAAVEGLGTVGDPIFPSVYVMASYVLTGEHRSYRPTVGAFGSVHSDKQFPGGGAGAWELATRYSYLDLDSEGVQGGALHDWTLGLNWYANDNTRVMFNYIAAHPEGFGVEHILMTRIQFSF